MKQPLEKPTVRISEIDGNAFSIIGTVKKALKKSGADKEYISQYFQQATSGDYDHLLAVTVPYVNIR